MKHPDLGPGVLDDKVQKNIASLEHAKERVARIAELARNQYYGLTQEVALLQQQQRAHGAALSALGDKVARAEQRLTELAEAHAGAGELLAAARTLAEAATELRRAEEQDRDRTRSLTWLEESVRGLGQMAEEGGNLTDEIAAAVDFLAANFRELGSFMESAQQSRALGLHVIRAQEEERRRLAREIHDGPTQLLNSVVLRIDVCQRFFDSDPERLKDELQQLKELVRLSLQDVRKIIFDLRPMALDDLGVVPALRTFLKDYQARTGIETDFSVFGNDRRYDPAFEIAIFRIVQEALTNVFKHAGASRVWVKVETAGGKEIKVQVKDDGVGFDPSEIKPGAAGTKFGL
ncbi:MAG TPA: sensor histidine kinase, partial [Symbiobacteriaceae bacterium]|nr:sensor histidine kinase [Symbiobacteriaceae bacterium]